VLKDLKDNHVDAYMRWVVEGAKAYFAEVSAAFPKATQNALSGSPSLAPL
jgi:hypothetical protein